MYLKRLDIQGFKSFATRTGFEFGQGITAIVGPNGSGKSNIADALRWVLGEQSGRALRARKTEDAIFAGSSKRQRADRAEVTLVMDNADGWLPLDFAEVALSRRAHRSGESDYRINRKKVRLRDVQALLAQGSVAQSSYAIIGQGLVETILNLRPDERRQLIEEAADTQRYRLRIEEAQGKLAATHENLERIKLLVKEIAPRLGQLERQAKRADDYARISRELAQALHAYYGHQWHDAHEKVAVARAAHDQAQADFTQAKVAMETTERELAEVGRGLEGRRRAAAASAADRQRLTDRIRELEQSLAVSTQRRALLEGRQRELKEEIAALETERAQADEIVNGLDARRAKLVEELAIAKAEMERRRADLDSLESEIAGGEVRAAGEEARSERLRVAAKDVDERVERLGLARADLESEIARLDTRRRAIIGQMVEQVRVLRGYRADDARLAESLAGVSERRASLEAEVAESRQALSEVEAMQNERRGKLEALEARLAVLTEAQRQLRSAPEDEQPVTVEGALAAIYEIVRVPRGLEQAIEAALSDMVEAFIVQREIDALETIKSLVARDASRATVLPLEAVKQVYPLNIIREKGVVGVASQLVRCPPQYQKLVNALLGRTIVVRDLETAQRIVRRGLGTVVTMDGVVFHTSGAITAGFPRVTRPYALGHERDLEAIPKEIERIRRSLEVTEREVEAMRERLRAGEQALGGSAGDAETALGRRMRVQESIAERQRTLAQLRGEMRGLISSQANLRRQEEDMGREARRLAQEKERSLAQATELEESAGYLRRASTMIEQRREELRQAAIAAAAPVAEIDAQLQSQDVQCESAKAALTRIDSHISAKGVQLRGIEMEQSTLSSSVDSDERELERQREELRPLVEAAAPDQGETVQLEARERELHRELLAAQSRMFQAERHALETEAEVRCWETEIDTLRHRIQEDGLRITADGDIAAPAERQSEASVPLWLAAEPADEGPDDLRPISGGAGVDPERLGRDIDRLKGELRRIGPVNIEAMEDYAELRDRHDFLSSQLEDLKGAEKALHRAIEELYGVMRNRFQSTYETVAAGFEEYFKAFFGGGKARLSLTDRKDLQNTGVEVEAQPPGKRLQNLAQLSGGEKALTAVALLFALLNANPSPFCVLDEVDAMLDEANVGRFVGALKELAKKTQFIVITHNRRTIEVADSIYGVSMGADAASRVLSLRLADIKG
jgi:chromosome segregation protein